MNRRIPAGLLALAASAVPAFGQGFVSHASPPAVERGKTTRVTFHGRDLGPAVGLWASLPAGAMTAAPVESHPDRVVLDVTASPDAPVGVFGLRIATRDGLTNAHLFHVEDLPVQAGTTSDAAMTLAPPAAVWGTFRDGGVDRYRIDAAAGERLSIEVVANRFGKDADPLVTVRDAAGKLVAERDNDPGLYFDCRFEHAFETAGTYTLEVRDSRFHGGDERKYLLRVGRFPAGRVALPPVTTARYAVTLPEVADAVSPDADLLPGWRTLAVKRSGDDGSAWVPVAVGDGPVTVAREPDPARERGFADLASPAMVFGYLRSPLRANPFLALDATLTHGRLQATPAVVPGNLCGVLRRPGERDAFTFRLEKGQRVFVRGETRPLNSPADIELTLTDRVGRELRRGTETRDAVTLEFQAQTAGEYGLIVRDQLGDGGPAHTYLLAVRDTPFPPTVTAEVEGLTVPQGTHQPIPMTVARTGAGGPVRLKLLGAAPGLRLTPAEIPDGANAVVCRLEADRTAPLGVSTLQIVAESNGERALVRTLPLIDRKRVNVDLIPIALRDDQTRPPPSLGDRFAVQVTPPAPFDFELPEPVVTLPRYQSAAVPVATTRTDGFDGPITFTAKGGQLGPKTEGRTRVYAEFPDATAEKPRIDGRAVSLILSETAKRRIEVTGTGTHRGRRVSLTRAFDLDLVPAFRVAADPPKLALKPGETASVRLTVARVPTFAGPVRLRLAPADGVAFPEELTVPADRGDVALSLTASPAVAPRRFGLQLQAAGLVGGFEEETRAAPLEIEVPKPETPKK